VFVKSKNRRKNLTLPGNPRYQPPQLKPFLGYDNLYLGVIKTILAVLRVNIKRGIVPQKDAKRLTPKITRRILKIRTTEVDRVERKKTHHDIRALVRIIQKIVGPKLARWIYFPLTSYDGICTGMSWLFLQAYLKVIAPSAKKLVKVLVELIIKYAGLVQIGRTHGQHALPITFGFWLATILFRFVYSWQQADRYAKELLGKISGAVGAYNAQLGTGIEKRGDKITFEQEVLKRLGLKPALISTQILPPEPMAFFLFSISTMSAAIAQLGNDARHLMRTEIGEVTEAFDPGQVGSSTMGNKRNPLNFENTVGMWLKTIAEFQKVMLTMISDHQRDLVGSSVLRDFATILVNLQEQMNKLLRKNKSGVPFLGRIVVDAKACQRNLRHSAGFTIGEPLYIWMQIAGYEGDAHKLVNEKLMPIAQAQKISLLKALTEIAKTDEKVAKALQAIPVEAIKLLRKPNLYIGKAKEKALEIANWAKTVSETLG
jgi:adenylosuccinate lyase